MDKLFLQIINMSITSSYVILFVIVVRFFLKKAPKIFSYVLWAIPFFRLIFPFSFESIFSLISINRETIPENIAYSPAPQIQSGITAIDSTVNRALPSVDVSASVNPMQVWFSIGSTIWILGILVLIGYSIFSTLKLSRELKSARLVEKNIYRIDTIKTPFVFGLIRPSIYLPDSLSLNEESYIIKHEETHIKRFDHIIKFMAFLIVSLHWFNPLVWFAFYLMSEDMELSCDESVIKEMGYEIKKDYSNSLLSLSIGRRIVAGSPIAFGENNPKGRIKNILNYKKPKFWVVAAALIVLLLLGVGLLSDRPGNEQNALEKAREVALREAEKITDVHGYSILLSQAEDVLIGDSEVFALIKEASIDAGYQEDDFNNMSGDRRIISFELVEKSVEKETVALDIVVDKGKAIGAYLSYYGRSPGIEPIYYKDFIGDRSKNIIEGDHIGYITMMNLDENRFYLDPVEFLGLEDKERVEELGFKVEEEMPSGFMIYNPETDSIEFTLTNETKYLLLDWSGELNHISVTKEEFIEYNNSLDYSPLYNIFIKYGYVQMISEQYIP